MLPVRQGFHCAKWHLNRSPFGIRIEHDLASILINLSYGTMTGRNVDGNQTKPYNLNVTCTPGTY